jgi:hypothetical protein
MAKIITATKRDSTALRIIKAIHESHGLVTKAASAAGVTYRTVLRYINDYPSVAEAVETAREQMLDFAESKLYQLISEGDKTAIIFYLKTQGKCRGYIERQEVTGENGSPITPPVINVINSDSKKSTAAIVNGEGTD